MSSAGLPTLATAPAGSARAAWVEVNLDDVAYNARQVKTLIGPDCELMAVVKADGYGLGAAAVARAAIAGGASRIAVACVDEGLSLRAAGIDAPVLVMGYASPDEAQAVVSGRLTLVIAAEETARALDRAAAELGVAPGSVPVHVKVDTGLHRYGCLPEQFFPLAGTVLGSRYLRLQGLMTHFASADSPDVSFAYEQLARFEALRAEAERRGIAFDAIHACNSAATLALPEARYSMVRVGIMLSGHLPAAHFRGAVDLRPAVSIKARLARVVKIGAGESVGYGQTWRAEQASIIGLVPVGYADGYRRAFSNRGCVLVNGVSCPVVGRVSMDQVTVDLTGAGPVAPGTEVVLLGSQGQQSITAEDLAGWADTISYEILTGLSRRLPRRYISWEPGGAESPQLSGG